jgi:ribosomal protein S18 acetylase RimI-like enzyme
MPSTVTCFRPYRNTDSPALADLWNQGLPERGVVRPLTVHEFDALVMGKLGFEREGLIVAERDGRVVGYAHAGFGPVQERGPSHRLDFSMGTVALMVLEPGLDEPEIEAGLFQEAEHYLRQRGAEVIYAGGRHPLDPFYWGIYGGSEFAGVLGTHESFHRAALRRGYQPMAQAVLLELELADLPPADPRAILLRRQVRFESAEDVLPDGWWQALAIGLFRPSRFALVDRATGEPIARAMTWDVACGVGIDDGRPRTALIGLEVVPPRRRQGFGRLLVAEIARHCREQYAEVLLAQTDQTNAAALALYASLDFEPVDRATLYRLPGPPEGRAGG